MYDLYSATILLILVIDAFGNIPLVIAALRESPPARRRWIILRECAFGYAILLGFMLGGNAFLALLHLSEHSLSIAGGIVLFLIALRLVFHEGDGSPVPHDGGEPFLVPLAVPAIAGPSAMATSMLLVSRDPAHLGAWVLALTIAMTVTALVLVASVRLEQLIGRRPLIAIQRLMGLVLTALAVEMLLDGFTAFLRDMPR